MGRPKLKDAKKKVTVSISVSRAVAELAAKTENQSHFYQTSVECCRALAVALGALREGRDVADALEEIGDIGAIWMAEFDDSAPFAAMVEEVVTAARSVRSKAPVIRTKKPA